MSVFIDIELRFAASSPVDPTEPLKNVTYSEDCDGFICDLTDIQIIPGCYDLSLYNLLVLTI